MKIYKKLLSFAPVIVAAALLIIMLALAVYPNRYVPSALCGIKLWAYSVLPSLLPYFFLTALLSYNSALGKITNAVRPVTKALYNTSGLGAYAQIMSFLSGYPIGAKIIAELYENNLISQKEAKKMCAFCSTSGPLFIIGAVGVGMYENKAVGAILLFAHLLSAVANGIIFRGKTNDCIGFSSPLTKKCDNVLYEAIYSSVLSVLIVGGFISVFYCFSQILLDFNVLKPLSLILSPLMGENTANAFLCGLIECTRGAKMLSETKNELSVILTSALISFGGVSVMCQSIVYLKKAQISFIYFLFTKLVQMLVCALICALLLLYFKPF